MDKNVLVWLSEWYGENCDGNWEHQFGIKIETIDNPGWSIIIDLEGTVQEKLENTPWLFVENNASDWYGYKIEDGKFEASGDPGKLDFLINLYKDKVDKCD